MDCSIGFRVTAPAEHDLFEVDEQEEALDETRADIFYRIIGKLLYVLKSARIDIDLMISFLCTCVAKSSKQDWSKLRRLLTYLKRMLGIAMFIGADSMRTLYIWVGAFFQYTYRRGRKLFATVWLVTSPPSKKQCENFYGDRIGGGK